MIKCLKECELIAINRAYVIRNASLEILLRETTLALELSLSGKDLVECQLALGMAKARTL